MQLCFTESTFQSVLDPPFIRMRIHFITKICGEEVVMLTTVPHTYSILAHLANCGIFGKSISTAEMVDIALKLDKKSTAKWLYK